MTDALCPRCGELVAMRHNGGTQANDRTSPWVFVDHMRDDERGGVVTRQPCSRFRQERVDRRALGLSGAAHSAATSGAR